MLIALVSPLPLTVDSEVFELLSVGVSGSDSGKHVYINSRALKNHHKFYFDGGEYESTLNLLKAELSKSKNFRSTLSNWFDSPSILALSIEDVDDFSQLYSYTKEPDLISALTEMPYDETLSIGEYLLINGLGELFKVMRKLSKEGAV